MPEQERAPLRPSRRRQLARWQREQRRQRIGLAVGVAAVVLVLSLVAAGYITAFVLPPRQVVARVNDTVFRLGDIVKILRMFERGGVAPRGLDLAGAPFQVLTTLVDNELIRQAAPRYGLSVTEEEIDREVRRRILGESPEGDPGQLEKEFRERYRQYLNLIGLSEKEHRHLVLYDLYREKLRDVLGQEVPTVLPQVHLYRLTLATPAQFAEVKTEFERGATFAQLVEKYSSDPEEVRTEGEVGWVPKGLLPDLDDLLFDRLEVGQLSEPVVQPDGTALVYLITERVQAREVDPENRDRLKTRALEKWLLEERKRNRVETFFDSDKYAWVVKQLRLTRPTGQ